MRPAIVRLARAAGLAAAAAVVAASAASAAPPSLYWVFFRDGGSPGASAASGPVPSTGVLVTPRAPSPRALARRERARRERVALGRVAPAAADSMGASPSPSYVAAVAATGARLRTRSRWLNAVSVRAGAVELSRIRALPFVADVRPVALGSDQQSPSNGGTLASGVSDSSRTGASVMEEAGDVAEAGPSYPQLALAGIPEAHALGVHGEGVLIGVLDTGFVLDHEVFGRLETRAVRDFVQGDGDPSNDPDRAPPDPPMQQNHGTQVLSLLAAYAPGRMIGAAYGASFVLAKTERTNVEQPAEEDLWCAGLEWAEAEGADVITTSISFDRWYRRAQLDGRTAVTTRMANAAWERGVLLINAAGNYGPRPSTIGAPADAPGVITVGAVDLEGRLAPFSSRGPTGDGRVKPDLTAPGSGVLVVTAGTRGEYERGSGTSFAAPLVAGVAALVLQAHPDWGPEAVREAIVMSGARADAPARDDGWGLVDARRAILYPFLEGRVSAREGGAAISGATVSWERVGDVAAEGRSASWAAPGDAPSSGATRSDGGGGYTIPNLPPGRYRLSIRAEGFAPEEIGPFDVPPNLEGVDVPLSSAR